MQFDLIDISVQKLAAMQCPAACVSTITGIPASDLSVFLNKQRPVPNHKAKQIFDAVTNIERLVESVAPVPVDFRRSGLLKLILEKFDARELLVFVDEITEAVAAK